MNPKLEKIYDICREALNDQKIGPVNKNFYNDLIFGIQKIDKGHLGYLGWEFVKNNTTFNESTNCYSWDFNDFNISDDTVKFWEGKNKILTENYLNPLFLELYDVCASTRENINQTELGHRLGIPKNLSNTSEQSGRMTSELVSRAENSGLIKTEKIGRCKIIKANDRKKLPKSTYKLVRKYKSKNEAFVLNILNEIKYENDYDCEIIWGYRFSDFRKYPYDFAIQIDGEPIGLIEVDGAQHKERIEFFFKNEEDFQHRLEIDKLKTEYAKNEGISLLRIDEGELIKKKNKEYDIEDKISEWFGKIMI